MFKKIENRQNVTGIVILFYLLTVIFLTAVAVSIVPGTKSWNLMSWGILLSAAGSGATLNVLRLWENHIKSFYEDRVRPCNPLPVEAPPPEKEIEDNTPLYEAMIREKDTVIGEVRHNLKDANEMLIAKEEVIKQIRLENDRQKEEISGLAQQFDRYKEETENKINQQAVLCEEYRQTMTDQRSVIKKKQRDIEQLENKIRDLNYEIKTLLELNDSFKKQTPEQNSAPPSSSGEMMLKDTIYTYQVMEEEPVMAADEFMESTEKELIHTTGDASGFLKRCINIAQKITGAHQFSGGMSRFKEIGMETFALDRRRLFDNLRSENSSCVLIFSPKDDKALFVNNQIKTLLNWSPDSFVENFHEIIEGGVQEWKRAIARLGTENEVAIRLLMKTKNGQDVFVHCLLGSIPTGLFRKHVVCILYQD